jgi:Bacterial PH domain
MWISAEGSTRGRDGDGEAGGGRIRRVSRRGHQQDTKFRYNGAIPIAGLVALIGTVPLATVGFVDRSHGTPGWAYLLLLILIVPLAVTVWGWRAGTDAGVGGIQVRPYGLASRRVAWTEIVGVVPQKRRVYAILADERAIPLPGVTKPLIPRLIAASGQSVQDTADQTEPTASP